MYDLLIHNVAVVDPAAASAATLSSYDIAIHAGRIALVQLSQPLDSLSAIRVLPGDGLVALPGLINAHAHAPMVLFRGAAEDVPIDEWFNAHIWPMETNLTPDDVYWGAMLAMVEMIESGVTTVADHYFAMDRVAEAVTASGLRGHLACTMFGQNSSTELQQAADFAARWHNTADGRIQIWLGPHAPYTCSPEFLQKVGAAARELGIGCHIHVSETAEQVQQSIQAHGVSPVRLLERLGLMSSRLLCAHAAHVDADDLAILAEHQVGVAHCPKTFLKLAAGIAPVVEMRGRGIAVGLGSDGAASNNTLDMLEQMRLAAMLQKHARRDARALPVSEALTLATSDGARALGQGDVLGQLQPGYLADIILVRLDGAHVQPLHNLPAALVYAARASDVDTVIVNGIVLMQQRTLLTLNKAEIVQEVNARAERLRQRHSGQTLQTYQS